MKRVLVLLFVAACAVLSVSAQALDPAVEARIDGILKKMTLEEKVELLGGVNFFQVRGAPRVGLPVMTAADSPFGVRNGSRSTLYAGGINLAATFNSELANAIGVQIGRDARARGVHFNLGPGVNIYRSPLNGRNFEYFGEDPFLASRMAVGYINGVQSQGVSATVKHFLANNSEFDRHDSDSIVDERTLREIYLPAFEAAVKEAKTGSIMDSYNLINGLHATQNGYFNTDILRTEWGFTGVVMSDWDATYDALGAANGGLDLEMPSGKFLNLQKLKPLLDSGQVKQSTIDEKVRRILRLAARMGWMDRPQLDPSVPLYNQAGIAASLQAAREGMVLLKNDGAILPLDRAKIKKIAVIGPEGYPTATQGYGSAIIPTFKTVSFLEGIAYSFGPGGQTLHSDGIPTLERAIDTTAFTTDADGRMPGVTMEGFANPKLEGAPMMSKSVRSIKYGGLLDLGAMTLGMLDFGLFQNPGPRPASVRWIGYYAAKKAGKHDVFVRLGGFDKSGFRLFVDGKLVADRWAIAPHAIENFAIDMTAGAPHKVVLEYYGQGGVFAAPAALGIVAQGSWVAPETLEMAKNADAVVIPVGFDVTSEGEGFDRTFALPPGQDELVRAIASVNKNAIVVVTAGGGVEMTRWIDSVPGLVHTWYAGQEGGTALGEILFGRVNPSGRLPATFERKADDNPAFANYYETPGTNKIEYKEGIFVGYRGYEKNGVKPLFPFGFGLSYTTFAFTAPAVKSLGGDKYEVSFDVKNTGKMAGAAVPQVYVGERTPSVARPAKELKGFAKVFLQPGETRRVTVPLDFRSFAYYDVAAKSWKANAGLFDVLIGSSSAQIEAKTEVRRGGVSDK